MSHTNQTQYYELPQYVGTDIINPLVDTNGAYQKIDTALHNIAEVAGQSTTDIADLQTKVGTGVFATTAQNATDAVGELYDELNDAGTGVKDRVVSVENEVDTLQSQMVTAQGNIVDLQNNKASQSDVTAVANDVSTLQTTVGDANSGLVKSVADVNTNVTDIYNELSTYVERIRNKKILILGDSISVPNDTWASVFKTFVESNGGTVVNRSVGGYQTSDIITVIANESDTDYDDVIIFVGTNDCMNDLNTFKANCRTLGTNARTKFANAEIFWITPLFSPHRSVTDFDGHDYGVNLSQNILSVIIKNACQLLGINCINGMSLPSIQPNGTHLRDGLHVAVEYAPYMCAWIFNKICAYVDDFSAYAGYYQEFTDFEFYDNVDVTAGNLITPENTRCYVHITPDGAVHFGAWFVLPATTLTKGIGIKMPVMLQRFITESAYKVNQASIWYYNGGTGTTRVFPNVMTNPSSGVISCYIDSNALNGGIDDAFTVSFESVNYDILTYNTMH